MEGRFKPWPVYILGTAFIGEGVLAFIYPTRAYDLFGVPLLSSSSSSSTTTSAKSAAATPDKVHPAALGTASGPGASTSPSPFMYAKSARDIVLGLTFCALQAIEGHGGEMLSPSVTAFGAAVAVAGALDGWVVWKYAREDYPLRKRKAYSHWTGTAALAFWVFLRATRTTNRLLTLDGYGL